MCNDLGTMVVVHSNNFEKCVSDVKLHVLFHSQFLRAFFPTFDSVYCALNRLNEMNLFVKFVVYALNMCVRALELNERNCFAFTVKLIRFPIVGIL